MENELSELHQLLKASRISVDSKPKLSGYVEAKGKFPCIEGRRCIHALLDDITPEQYDELKQTIRVGSSMVEPFIYLFAFRKPPIQSLTTRLRRFEIWRQQRL